MWEEVSEPEAGTAPDRGGALGPGELVPKPGEGEPSFGREPADTLRMGPKPPPAQPRAWADISGSGARTVPSPAGASVSSASQKLGLSVEEPRAALTQALVPTASGSQHPCHPLPGTPPSRPSWAESASVGYTGISRVRRRERPGEPGRFRGCAIQHPACQLLPQAPG